MTEQEMMDIWMKMAAPGPEHALMAKHCGEWTATLRSWMSPGQPPAESTGEAVFSMQLGGRVRQEDFHCAMGGMTFDGLGMLGFDNYSKKFWLTWMDNMSTALMVVNGTLSADGKELALLGRSSDPASGQNDVSIKCVYRFLSDDHHVFEAFKHVDLPQEVKTLEVHYRRK